MKKVLKNPIILIIICAFFFSGLGAVFAYSLVASNVSYTPKDSSWNVANTKEAIDELRIKAGELSTKYSTEEKVVGKWIDGKPVYQKSIVCGNLNAGSNVINHNISNLDRVINYNGISDLADGGTQEPIPQIQSSINWSIGVGDINTTTFSVLTGSAYSGKYALRNVVITLQYTKTTD